MEMNYKELKLKFKDSVIIDSQSINLTSNPPYFRRQISEWKKKNWIIELRKGIYVINDVYFTEKISPLYAANVIYKPSYISLEYALYEYDLIPETAHIVTSVTTKKTAYFENNFGRFSFTKIKNNLFFGFKTTRVNNQIILYATKEKALLDFLYINLSSFNETFDDFYSYRFQNLKSLSWTKLDNFLKKFNVKKLKRVVKLLKEFAQEESYKEL